MILYTRKHHTQGIPIVPMLDILTILLIFFIVHTEFKHQVNVLKLDLPRTEHLAGETGDRNSLLLELGEDGTLAFAGQLVATGQLAEAVRMARAANPETRVQVSAAGGSSLERFIEVLDILSSQGIPVDEIPLMIEATVQPMRD